MATEPLYDRRRTGFPKQSDDGKSLRTIIEYVGIEADLRAALPNRGATWGEYPGIVESAEIEPLESTDYAILSMTVEKRLDQTLEMSGTKSETAYEIDWVTVSRPLMEHRDFNKAGLFYLTETDRTAIKAWEEEADPNVRKNYSYSTAETSEALSANAKKYAQGVLLGVENYDFKAPVLRMTESYVNGPPPEGSAGIKDTPPSSFPRKPSGYEWVKEADRSIKAGKNNRWERTQEWVGAKKVLIDAEEVFWDDADLA